MARVKIETALPESLVCTRHYLEIPLVLGTRTGHDLTTQIMRYSLPYRWLLILGTLPILSLVNWESRASASCGDYVHIVNTNESIPASDHPVTPHEPCHGPGCNQQRPIPPMPVPVPTTTQQAPSDAILFAPAEYPDSAMALPIDPEASSRPHRIHTSIFHPPR